MSDSDKREAEVDRLRRTLDDWKEVLVLVKVNFMIRRMSEAYCVGCPRG
jgi:hypothetical protein